MRLFISCEATIWLHHLRALVDVAAPQSAKQHSCRMSVISRSNEPSLAYDYNSVV